MRRSAVWLVVPILALALAACTGEGEGAPDPDELSVPDGSRDTVVQITDTPGSVDGFTGASQDAEVTTCESVGSIWVAEGTVTNPTDQEQTYRVYVGFTKNRDTRGLVQVDVASVAAGESESFTAEAELSDTDLSCVLRVERFDP